MTALYIALHVALALIGLVAGSGAITRSLSHE